MSESVTINLHVTATYVHRDGAVVGGARVEAAIEAAIAAALSRVRSEIEVEASSDWFGEDPGVGVYEVDECCIVGPVGGAVSEAIRTGTVR